MINTMPFFHLFNSVILGYFLYFLIKKYFISTLIQQREEDKRVVILLEQQYHQGMQTSHYIHNQMNAQKLVYTHLEQRITQWKQKVEEERTQQKILHYTLQEKLTERRSLQQKGFNKERYYQEVVPVVLKKAEQSLSEKADTLEGHTYIEKIIAGLS